MTAVAEVTEVAAAIIFRTGDNGTEYLLAQRPRSHLFAALEYVPGQTLAQWPDAALIDVAPRAAMLYAQGASGASGASEPRCDTTMTCSSVGSPSTSSATPGSRSTVRPAQW